MTKPVKVTIYVDPEVYSDLIASSNRYDRSPGWLLQRLWVVRPSVSAPLVVAEPPTPLVNTNTPTNTTDQHPAEVAPPKKHKEPAPPKALSKAQMAERLELLRQRHQALITQGKIKRRA